jgi:hypothetical protein
MSILEILLVRALPKMLSALCFQIFVHIAIGQIPKSIDQMAHKDNRSRRPYYIHVLSPIPPATSVIIAMTLSSLLQL